MLKPHSFRTNAICMKSVLLGSLFAMLLVAAATVRADDRVSVAGTATVQVVPDKAIVTFSVTKESKSAEEAKTAVNAIVKKLIDKFKKQDGKDLKLISRNISINKNRNYQTGEILNYNVSVPFEIEVYNLALLNQVLDDAIAAGVDDINPIAYQVRDDSDANNRALQAALVAAKGRAEKMAAFYGRQLGAVEAVEDAAFISRNPGPMLQRFDAAMKMREGAGGVMVMAPEHLDFSSTVYVTYGLK